MYEMPRQACVGGVCSERPSASIVELNPFLTIQEPREVLTPSLPQHVLTISRTRTRPLENRTYSLSCNKFILNTVHFFKMLMRKGKAKRPRDF